VKSITYPVVGNHEYQTRGAAGHFDYFGARAGDRSRGYYSFDVGTWHVVALNSNCSQVGGCGAGSPQEQWLRADLAANDATCTAVLWHHPRWSQGQYDDDDRTAALYRAAYDAGADVLLVGHDHNYQRFARRAPDGSVDAARGIRQFVVGTGGKSHYSPVSSETALERSDATSFGVLELRLRPTGYDWAFVPAAGGTFTDAGSSECSP
jgi:hypothetical protein